MEPIPAGTITFLFTDIEGSTRRWEHSPGAMSADLARHDELLRVTIQAHHGYVFKTVGDAFCAAFPDAASALAAATEGQKKLHGEAWKVPGGIRVRMALHTGAAEIREGDYFGPTLNRVARVLSTGHGGQILLSNATAGLVSGSLPQGVELRDMGVHRLKDLALPEEISLVAGPELPEVTTPLTSLDGHPNNLPVQVTSFLGREGELEQSREMLGRVGTRLLTLIGTGGAGKTRLALQLGAELIEHFAHGVFFVPLEFVADAGGVADKVARTLEIREGSGAIDGATLRAHLAGRQTLLILDNFEHLLDAALLVAELIASCAGLKVIVTSRVALGISGEQRLPVEPLAVPPAASGARRQRVEPLRLHESPAVRLFLERARQVAPALTLSEDELRAVAEICRRLDGLPLAIELAAARVRHLSPRALLARLNRRLPLLTGGARDRPARHQTLRAAIRWSYDLLKPEERQLVQVLSVFEGGISLEAADSVVSAVLGDGLETLDATSRFLDWSFVSQSQTPDGEPRYAYLETVREFAQECLEAGELAIATRQGHARYFLRLAQAARVALTGPEQVGWMSRLEQEHDNVRAALRYFVAAEEAVDAVRLGAAMWRFWEIAGHLAEGRELLESILTATEGVADSAFTDAALGLGALAHDQGDFGAAQRWYRRALEDYRAMSATQGVADSLNNLGNVSLDLGEREEARALYEDALRLRRELGDRRGVAVVLNNLGSLASDRGDYPEAARLHEQSLELKRQIGDRRGAASSLNNLANVCYYERNYTRALALLRESEGLFREVGDRYGLAMCLNTTGNVMAALGDPARAQQLQWESVHLFQELGNEHGAVLCLRSLAEVAASASCWPDAARLLGVGDAAMLRLGGGHADAELEAHQSIADQGRTAIGGDAWEASYSKGANEDDLWAVLETIPRQS